MTTFKKGDDVTVTFDGIEHPGEIKRVENGWAYCRIAIDPSGDYGGISARLAPQSLVCVRLDDVRPQPKPGCDTPK